LLARDAFYKITLSNQIYSQYCLLFLSQVVNFNRYAKSIYDHISTVTWCFEKAYQNMYSNMQAKLRPKGEIYL